MGSANFDLASIKGQTTVGLNEYLDQAKLAPGSLFVLGLSTSEVRGDLIGSHSNIEIGRAIVNTICDILEPLGIDLAVQGCQHINRALVVERRVAKERQFEIVTVYPQIHAGGAGQIAAFERFDDPVEVEHIVAAGGMDIGDTEVAMHVKFVQIPVRTSVKEIGQAHATYLSSRPKLIGGARAKYEWDPFDEK